MRQNIAQYIVKQVVTWSMTVLLMAPSLARAQVFRGYNEDQNAAKQDKEKRTEVRVNYESGALHLVAPYKRGKLDGTAKEYYENGTLKAEIRFQDNRRDGIARYYHPSGMLQARILYNRDKEVGKSKFYAEDGTLTRAPGISRRVHSAAEDIVADSLKVRHARQRKHDTPDSSKTDSKGRRTEHGAKHE
jgi:hypothetical protein